MKNLSWLLLALTASTAGAGGIAVTNGQKMYTMAGLTVQYAPELTLREVSKISFDISNPQLVRKEERVSKISFTVKASPGKKVGELKDLLKKKFPGKDILPIQQSGAAGYYWEERSASSLFGHYDLLTSNGDLVDIELEAYAAGDGIKWIAPIVRSIVYDATAPILREVRFENPVWEAGSTQKLYLKIIDDYSGVDEDLGLSFESPDPRGGDERAYYYLSGTKLVSEGDDWYSAKVSLGRYLPNREFRFNSIHLNDRAGNRRRYVAQGNAKHYAVAPAEKAKKVAVARVAVSNAGPSDVKAPELLGFRADSSVWQVGSTHRVYFRLEDDVSGVSVSNPEIGISQPCSTFHEGKDPACNGFDPGRFESYRAEGHGWYSAAYTVRDYLPSGEYRINAMVVSDEAGNVRMQRPARAEHPAPGLVPEFKVRIHNPGAVDVAGPELHEWKVSSGNWKAGEKAKIYFRASDAGAGINWESVGFMLKRVDGAAGPSIGTDSQSIVNEGNDWYSIDVNVEEFTRAGTYYPSLVIMMDNAANSSILDCQPDGSCQVRGGKAQSLAPLPVEIFR